MDKTITLIVSIILSFLLGSMVAKEKYIEDYTRTSVKVQELEALYAKKIIEYNDAIKEMNEQCY